MINDATCSAEILVRACLTRPSAGWAQDFTRPLPTKPIAGGPGVVSIPWPFFFLSRGEPTLRQSALASRVIISSKSQPVQPLVLLLVLILLYQVAGLHLLGVQEDWAFFWTT